MAVYNCAACGYSKSAKDELIGKRAKCPKCGEVNAILADVPAPVPVAPEPEEPFFSVSEEDLGTIPFSDPDPEPQMGSSAPETTSYAFKEEESDLPMAAPSSFSSPAPSQQISGQQSHEPQEIQGDAGTRGFLILLLSSVVLFFFQLAAIMTIVIYPFTGTREGEMAKVGQVTGLVLAVVLLVCSVVSVFGLKKLRNLASGKPWKKAVLRSTAVCIAIPCFLLIGAIGPLVLDISHSLRLQLAAISNLLAFAALIFYLNCLILLMKQCGEFLQNQRVVALSEKAEPALRWWLIALVGMVCLVFTSAFLPNPPAALGLASLAALGLFIVSEVNFAVRFLIAMGAASRACYKAEKK